MAHLKRYHMPVWPLPTKGKVYVTRPRPGPHPLRQSMPLLLLVRDQLKAAETGDEARAILRTGAVVVDGIPRRDPNFPLGLMDSISIPKTGEHYRVSLGGNRLTFEPISPADATRKLCKVTGKSLVRGSLVQLHLHDGRNVLTKDPVQVGDTLDLELPSQQILARYPLAEGSRCLITGGKNQGLRGTLEKIHVRKAIPGVSTAAVAAESSTVETRLSNIFITGGTAQKVTSVPKAQKKTTQKKKGE